MPLYMVRWPNGDLSIVKGRDKDDALVLLDRESDANGCPIREIKDADEFMVHFRLADSGDLELQDFDEPFHADVLMPWAYPILNQSEWDDKFPIEAVEAERNRVTQQVTRTHPKLADLAKVAKRISAGRNDEKSTRRRPKPEPASSPESQTT